MQALAKVVSHHMGGHGKSDAELMRQWQRVSRQLKRQHRSVVIPISALTAGLARHRALLFKVLADFCQIPCRLLRGQFYTGLAHNCAAPSSLAATPALMHIQLRVCMNKHHSNAQKQ